MILILGVELLRKYLKLYPKKNVCFYDDYIKSYHDPICGNIPFFQELAKVQKVIFSDDFAKHFLLLECLEQKIACVHELSVFLKSRVEGWKIGIVGKNYKASVSYLLKYIFDGLCSVARNIGVSPLDLQSKTIFVIEISDQSLIYLDHEDCSLFDVLIVTETKELAADNYRNVADKLQCAKDLLYFSEETVFIEPANYLFEERRYKLAWNVVCQLAQVLKLDLDYVRKKLCCYYYPQFKQEVINESPLIINDSHSTNVNLLLHALNCMKKEFVLICNDISSDLKVVQQIIDYNLLKKIFILSNKECKYFQHECYVNHDFNSLVKEAFRYAVGHNLVLLFSPGGESFEYFSGYQERGKAFNSIIDVLMHENK